MVKNPPASATDARSLIEFANFAGRNIHQLADILEPIRRLTRSDVTFHWGETEQQALNFF